MESQLSNVEVQIMLLGVWGLMWILGNTLVLHTFRRTLKTEQLVGVKFDPETIINRRIIRLNIEENFCMVEDPKSNRLVMVELHNVFVADPHSSDATRAFEMY